MLFNESFGDVLLSTPVAQIASDVNPTPAVPHKAPIVSLDTVAYVPCLPI